MKNFILEQNRKPLQGGGINLKLSTLYVILMVFIFNPLSFNGQTKTCPTGMTFDYSFVDYTFTSSATYSGTIEIAGTVSIENNATVQFDGAIYFAPDAKIIVSESSTFNILNTSILTHCSGDSWDGIYLVDNSTVQISNAEIIGAKEAIHCVESSRYIIIESTFYNNATSLKITDNNNGQGLFANNDIILNNNMLPDLQNLDIYGIYIENATPAISGNQFQIGSNAYSQNELIGFFNSNQIPVYIDDSDVKIENTEIEMNNANVGIKAIGGPSTSFMSNVDINSVRIYNSSYTSTNCTDIEGNINISITNSEFSDANAITNIFDNITGELVYQNNIVDLLDVSDAGLKITNSHSLINADISNSNFDFDYENAIEINSSSNINIHNNNVFNFDHAGIGIQLVGARDVNISDNDFNFDLYGPAIDIQNSRRVDVYENQDMDIPRGYGIKVTNNSSNVSVYDNDIDKDLGVAIYASYANDVSIEFNDIDYLNPQLVSNKIGISVNNINSSKSKNSIKGNNINIASYTGSVATCKGIYSENSPNTNITNNHIYDAGHAISFIDDNNNGIIACNNMHDPYYGFFLDNAIFGEQYGPDFAIGTPTTPYDNYWSNVAVSNGKAFGDVNPSYDHEFYYKSGINYSLSVGEYVVFGPFTTSQVNNPPNPGYCDMQLPAVGLTTNLSSSTLLNSNSRDKTVGFAIDTNNLNLSSSAFNNPQNIYTNNSRYYMVKNAYYKYKSNSNYQNLGLTSDSKYDLFEQNIDNTNIGVLYKIDNLIKQENYKTAKNYLNIYIPQNLAEINTLESYRKLIQFFETDSLSSQDSSMLLGIANGNPKTFGQGVYIARNLLNIYIIDTISSPVSKFMSHSISTESNQTEGISFYPNPSESDIFVDVFGDYNNRINYSVFSIEGKLLMQGEINNNMKNTIPTNNLENGVYFIKIDDGLNLSENLRFIKQ